MSLQFNTKTTGKFFRTLDGMNVDESVKSGQTKVFRHLKDAEHYNLTKRSYTYELKWFGTTECGQFEDLIFGYAVPN
jgi:hypothetical protein